MRIVTQADCSGSSVEWPAHMRRAFELARSVLSCAPNPRVGCVIVRDGRRAGEGFHAGAGRDHAEIAALAADPEGGAGATLFVTLEPCSHEGRTGPCTRALIEAGVRQVVVAGLDPNPQVSGVPELEAAGIEVFRFQDFAGEAAELNKGFLRRMDLGRPFVRCKLAMSLDGRTALANGQSKWITGAEARADAQLLRAGSCAIVTGVNTILADDPALNVRPDALTGGDRELAQARLLEAGQPLRVILDSELRTPAAAKTLGLDGDVKIFILREREQERAEEPDSGRKREPESGRKRRRTPERDAAGYPDNVELIGAPARRAKVDLEFVLNCLAARFECNEILVEAGPTLGGALAAAGLIDELVIYVGPRLLGSDAKPLLEFDGPDSLTQTQALKIVEVRAIGDGLKIVARPAAA